MVHALGLACGILIAIALLSITTPNVPNSCIEYRDASTFVEVPVQRTDPRALPTSAQLSFDPAALAHSRLLRVVPVHAPASGSGGDVNATSGRSPRDADSVPIIFLHGHRGSPGQANALATLAAMTYASWAAGEQSGGAANDVLSWVRTVSAGVVRRVRARRRARGAAATKDGELYDGASTTLDTDGTAADPAATVNDASDGADSHPAANAADTGGAGGGDTFYVPPAPRPYVVYAVDFAEASSAFHAGSLTAQAWFLNDAVRCVLGRHPSVTSVVVFGHSMGGVAARLAPLLANAVGDNGLGVVVTLNSPHQGHPYAVDKDVRGLYSLLNGRAAAAASALYALEGGPEGAVVGVARAAVGASADPTYTGDATGAGTASASISTPAIEGATPSMRDARLTGDVVLVSLTGGAPDNMVRPELTSLAGLVHPSRGFSGSSLGVSGDMC